MNKEIETKPQKMEELDYLLLELNNNNDNKVDVIKTQIKAKFNALQSANHKLIRKIKILRKMFIDECVSNGNVDTIFEKIFVEYIDLLSEKGGDE